MNRRWATTIVAGLMGLAAAGCAWVKPVHVNNEPTDEAGPGNLTGAGARELAFAEEVSPAVGAGGAGGATTVGVGPVLLSREALTLLDGDGDGARVEARAEAGGNRAMVAVENDAGEPRFFVAENYSREAQSVLVDALTKTGGVRVRSLDRVMGTGDMKGLARSGVEIYVAAHVSPAAEDGVVRLYIEATDTALGDIRWTASGEGRTAREAARAAADEMIKRVR